MRYVTTYKNRYISNTCRNILQFYSILVQEMSKNSRSCMINGGNIIILFSKVQVYKLLYQREKSFGDKYSYTKTYSVFELFAPSFLRRIECESNLTYSVAAYTGWEYHAGPR
jgi:hypothetical protein